MSSLHEQLVKLAKRVDGGNVAFGKAAGISSELDGVDNNTTPVSAAGIVNEHDKDQKSAQPQTVTDSAELGDMQEAMQSDQGIDKSEVGDDPEIEQNYSMSTDDPGTSHPAKADATNKSARAKYASANFSQLRDLYNEVSNAVCADIIVRTKMASQKKQPAAPQQPAAKPVASKQAAAAAVTKTLSAQDEAFAVGYKLAAELKLTKEAAANIVQETVTKLAAVANDDAEMVAAFLKAAESSDDSPMEAGDAEKKEPAGEESGTSGGDSSGDDTTAQAVEEIASAPAPEEGASAIDGMGEDEAMAALDDVLQEMGISPEELVMALQETAGDPAMGGGDPAMGGGDPMAADPAMAGGGDPMAAMDPMAGGAPPMDPAAMPPEAMKMASRLYNIRAVKMASLAAGKQIKKSKHHGQMRQYVKEVMGR
jgi:hypothetical protein